MNNLELINKINNFSFDNNEDELVSLLNDLLEKKDNKVNLQYIYYLISLTEMYGFLAYLDDEEKRQFLTWDTFRSISYEGKNIDFYNKGQLSLLYELRNNNKIFLSAPTSFGKTSIVIEYLLENYSELKSVLFIVPTNSLLEELYQKLLLLNKTYRMNYSITTQPHFEDNSKNLLLLTPERFLLIFENVDISKFDLIIMDETYKIVDSKNDLISDFLNDRSLRFRKVADIIGGSNNRVIFLSPFTYELSDSMKSFLEKFTIKKIDRKMEYVKRKIFDISDSKKFKSVFNSKTIGYTKSSSHSKKVNIILNQLYDKKNIVYVSAYSSAYKIVDGLQWNRNMNDNDSRFKAFISHLEKNFDIGEGHEWKIISALKKGVGIYVAPLPRYIKKEIIDLYERDIIGTLIVTTAFTEGVNTNASNLIFTTLVSGPSYIKLSDIDVLNVSGRVGRFAKNSVGNIYCINSDVYDRVLNLQNNASIMLENYNYKKSVGQQKKLDYEIDMIDEKYLTEEEKIEKSECINLAKKYNLSRNDLSISLNVSLKWKLAVYKHLKDITNFSEIYNACVNVTNEDSGKRVESMEVIFKFLKSAFEDSSIDGFPSKPYEIKAFDNKNQLIWSRLYKIYCAGKTKDIIKNNIVYINSEFEKIRKEISNYTSCKNDIMPYFQKANKGWILDYFDSELNINYDAFYTETFKFISNIVQYKIPFYVSFIISMVKMYIEKNNLQNIYDSSKIDAKETALLFENGNKKDEYNSMVDYGISNDLILKLTDANISYNDLINLNFDKSILDDYELIVIYEYINLMK